VLLLPFFLGFVLLPGSVGALACLLLVNFVPRYRKQALGVIVGLLLLGLGVWAYQMRPPAGSDPRAPDFIRRLLVQVTFAQGPVAPNHWMSRGLLAAARGDLAVTAYCLALVLSNGLFLFVLTAWLAGRLYRRGYNRIAASGDLRRRY